MRIARVLLLLLSASVGLSTVGCGSGEPEVSPERENYLTLKAVRNLGGTVQVVGESGDRLIADLQLRNLELDQAALEIVDRFWMLRTVDLSGSTLSDPWWPALAKYPGLSALDLSGTNADDAAVRKLIAAGPPNGMVVLDLADTHITDASLAPLAKLPLLQTLSLNRTSVTARGLEALTEAESLSEIRVIGTGITEAEAAAFREQHPRIDLLLEQPQGANPALLK